jgi:hypothetical protein
MNVANGIMKALLVVVWALCSTTVFCQQAIRNGLKLEDIPLHDPWILADGPSHTYYLYTSSRFLSPHAESAFTAEHPAAVVAWKSLDLKTWSGPYVVFQVGGDSWASQLESVWAPEVHAYHGKYYLFATLNNSGKQPVSSATKPSPFQVFVTRNGHPMQQLRATQVFVGDSPEGPFRVIIDRPIPPLDYMTLDGTFYVEDGIPYMVYAHEWVQLVDGTMEAVRMKADLSAPEGQPFFLFAASDAPWLRERHDTWNVPQWYVTDGPELYRTRKGKLLMLWSSYRAGTYVELLAHSESGKLPGPWKQDGVLVGGDSGHGMLFRTFEGRLILILHTPFDPRLSRARMYDIEDTGDSIRLAK